MEPTRQRGRPRAAAPRKLVEQEGGARVAVLLNAAELAELDRLRGGMQRGPFFRQLLERAASTSVPAVAPTSAPAELSDDDLVEQLRRRLGTDR